MDDYRELQVLGQGSFGQVCQVRRVVDGSVCCIKRVPLTGLSKSVMYLSLDHVSVLRGEKWWRRRCVDPCGAMPRRNTHARIHRMVAVYIWARPGTQSCLGF